ncbi:MAG TPA: NADH-ubiquinone oxidoreductase-F iron-sulfur binding region domain-containing protein [Ilumatobacteraceae bacterium]|nr:NADH-ubiquinone oxidoreductase-F iron-sulfur binding region domain-containing protein [Ilumatobacteraceae bacterium]
MSDAVEVAVRRVLPFEPYATLDEYVAAGGGEGLSAARAVESDVIIGELAASGLRGRGGAGFPTGEKWRTIKSFASPLLRTSVVVNAAEGEPGTFKDRVIIRDNPYAVIEGALIAARAMDAKTIVIATKEAFADVVARLHAAIAEVASAGWLADVEVRVLEGPSEYLYGEETALLEVVDDRPPFPRIAPPFRRGVVEVVESDSDVDSGSGLPADVQMAGTEDDSAAPPVLVNNVETMANVAAIIAKGADWFRSIGTADSPGTIVCTVTGAVQHPGVVEVAMGTPLRDVIESTGGVPEGRTLRAVMVGVSSAVLTAAQLDTELTYEAMAAVGSGLGSAGYIVIADDTEAISVAAGASRFLAIESCGQCTPCKQDGLEIARLLEAATHGQAAPEDLVTINERLTTVADGARCSLAAQQQTVIGSLLRAFDRDISARFQPNEPEVGVHLIAALVDIDDEGARVDSTFVDKQPDWTYDEVDSGKTPVERFTDHREGEPEETVPSATGIQ